LYYSFSLGQMKLSPMLHRFSRPRAFVLGTAIVTALASAFACTDISSDPNTVLSLQFDSLPAPGVVVGDTLRDTLGVVARPVVHAFNFQGEEIVPAPVFFVSPDSGVTVDSASGIVVADSLRASPARIVANVGTLQAIQKVSVTLRPDAIAAVNAVDSILYSFTDDTKNQSKPVTVSVKHGVSPADSAVGFWIVSFAIVSQHDAGLVELVNDAGKPSLVDTTDASGIAGRQIRLHPVNLASATQTDTVVVNATAKFRGAPVSGSPVRLVVVFKPGS
jgi:hypothetical protein